MRTRKSFVTIDDIKNDPDMRIIFQKPHYGDFLNLVTIATERNFNPTQFSRNLILIWVRKFMKSEVNRQNEMILEIMQSMHGLFQEDLFSPVHSTVYKSKSIHVKDDNRHNTSKPAAPKKKSRPALAVKKGKKKNVR